MLAFNGSNSGGRLLRRQLSVGNNRPLASPDLQALICKSSNMSGRTVRFTRGANDHVSGSSRSPSDSGATSAAKSSA